MALELPKIENKMKRHPVSGKQKSNSLETAFVNPFRITEDVISEMQHNVESSAWDQRGKAVMSRSERLDLLMGDEYKEKERKFTNESSQLAIPPSVRRQEKEDVTDFIAKKREMFLVQMSLDTKREEIRKLEEKAQKQEKALLSSEEKLKKDADEFELFLKKNDSNAQEAIRKAEEETAKKQKKTQEIKVLQQQLSALSSEISKQKELLKTCKEYKEFLDMLTPPEWFEKFHQERMNLREKMRKDNFAVRHKEWDVSRRKLTELHRKEQELKRESRRDRARKGNNSEHEDDDETDTKLVIPPAPKLDDEPMPILPDDEPPMYFHDPLQLMEIFSVLEEQNLFLIQNSQETELTLEELRHKKLQTELEMNTRTEQLHTQIDELNSQIANENALANSLQARRKVESKDVTSAPIQTNVSNEKEKEELIRKLEIKVKEVYEACGLGDNSARVDTLIMLSQLESLLESLLASIEKMPIEWVKLQEKEKEKLRREKKRIEQQLLLEQQQEERNRRAIERSLQAPRKRQGKPVMWRSRLIKREVNASNNEDDDKDNDDEVKHLT